MRRNINKIKNGRRILDKPSIGDLGSTIPSTGGVGDHFLIYPLLNESLLTSELSARVTSTNLPSGTWLAERNGIFQTSGSIPDGRYNVNYDFSIFGRKQPGSGQLNLVFGSVAPVITSLTSSGVTEGQTATIIITTTGTAPLSYQWQRQPAAGGGFVDISGAVSSSYTTPVTTVTGGTANHNDEYRCVVTNSVGSVTSLVSKLKVITAASASMSSITTGSGNGIQLGFGVSTHTLTLSVADTAITSVPFSISITNTGNGSENWSITPPANVTLSVSSGVITAGATINLTGTASVAGAYILTLVCVGASITGNNQSVVVSGVAANPAPFRNTRTGTRYTTLALAVAGSISGDTVTMSAGTYVISAFGNDDVGMTRIVNGVNLETFTLEWETPGVMPVIDISAYAYREASQGGRTIGLMAGPNNRTFTVRGLHLIGSQHDPSGGGGNAAYGINTWQGYLAGVGHNGDPPSTLNIEKCKLEHWGDGIKATDYNSEITINLLYSTIEDCSSNDKTHGIYISAINTLNVLGCTFRTTTTQAQEGHMVKSRARTTLVRGSLFDAIAGCNSLVEMPNGGTATIAGNIFVDYGLYNRSDKSHPIRYGQEQSQTQMLVTPAGGIAVDDVITAPNGASGIVTAVLDAGSRLAYLKTSGGTYFGPGAQVSVGGTVKCTIVSLAGSIDGVSNDTRVHELVVAQNTFRVLKRASWPAFQAVYPSVSMTDFEATPVVPNVIVRNNLIADTTTGNATLPTYPDNSSVSSSLVTTLGVYSGTAIVGSPAVNDAAYAYTGEFSTPSSRTDTYRGGRREGMPAWRQSMAAGTWKAVSTSVMNDVNPALDAAVNPNGVNTNSPWRGSDGQRAVIGAWGSSVWDEDNLTLWVPIGGGHGNYGGNEGYKQRLGDDVPSWVRVNNPSGSLTNSLGINLNDGQESSGVYSDGRPRSPHVYNNAAMAPGVGPVIAGIAAPYPNANTASGKVFLLDPATGAHTQVFDFTNATLCGFPSGLWPDKGSGVPNYINGAACYDPVRNRIWSLPTGNNNWLVYCVPSTSPGTWAGGHAGSTSLYAPDGIHGLCYWPDQDKILMMTAAAGVPKLYVFNPDTAARVVVTLTGSPNAGFATGNMWGFDWCPELGKLLLWNQTTSTHVISTLTPVGDGQTEWQWGELSVDPSNTVTPPDRVGSGQFGMFRYSSALRGCYVVTDYLEPTHFFATE